MINDLGKEKVAFTLAPGLKSFMQRSFPGARIWSQQSLLKEAGLRGHEDYKCLIDVRENMFDIVLLHRSELQCASTHPWKNEADIAYTLFSMLDTYEASPHKADIVLSGIRDIRQNTGKAIAEFVRSVSQKNHDLDGISIPTAVYLAINRKTKNANHTR